MNWPIVSISQLTQESIPGTIRKTSGVLRTERHTNPQLPALSAQCASLTLSWRHPEFEPWTFLSIGESYTDLAILGTKDHGFNPLLGVIPKTTKSSALLPCLALSIKGWNICHMISKRGTAAAHCSHRGLLKCQWQISLSQPNSPFPQKVQVCAKIRLSGIIT